MEIIVTVPDVKVEIQGDKIVIASANRPVANNSQLSSLAQQIASVEADSRPFGDH